MLGPFTLPAIPSRSRGSDCRRCDRPTGLATSAFTDERTRALFAGIAAHGMLPLDRALTAGVGLALGAMCHVAGWPIPRGGAQSITNALVRHLQSLGGEVVADAHVTAHRQAAAGQGRPVRSVAAAAAPDRRRTGFRARTGEKLERYRYGMGVFKVDWALSAPIPWTADDCRRAGHGASRRNAATRSPRRSTAHGTGRIADRPFVLLSQPTLFDPSRAPGRQAHGVGRIATCPAASTVDMLDRIERQIERFAPGFRDCVLARSVMTPADIEAHNANLVGGDIAPGVTDLRQFFTRPTWRNYSTPVKGLYICSASTPPGVGVHGMCGYYAAKLRAQDVALVLGARGSGLGARGSGLGARGSTRGSHRSASISSQLSRSREKRREASTVSFTVPVHSKFSWSLQAEASLTH